jgi:hypothetical protein
MVSGIRDRSIHRESKHMSKRHSRYVYLTRCLLVNFCVLVKSQVDRKNSTWFNFPVVPDWKFEKMGCFNMYATDAQLHNITRVKIVQPIGSRQPGNNYTNYKIPKCEIYCWEFHGHAQTVLIFLLNCHIFWS